MIKRYGFLLTSAFWATLYFFWAALFLGCYMATAGMIKLPALLLFIQCSVIGICFIVRRAPTEVSWKPFDMASSFLGTFFPFLFQPIRDLTHGHLAGIFVQAFGLLLTLVSVLSLNRAFGVLPANRGIKTGGMYRWVRHPLYASYLIANTGFLINGLTLFNGLVYFACLIAQILRVLAEERLLEHDAKYRVYQQQVRWRLIPFVF